MRMLSLRVKEQLLLPGHERSLSPLVGMRTMVRILSGLTAGMGEKC